MNTKEKILYWKNFDTIEKLIDSLRKDNVSITSTDTVLGLLANISAKSFSKLNEIKNRSAKSYIILVGSIEKLQQFTDVNLDNKKLKEMVTNNWPGPVTIIFKSKNDLPSYMKSENNTIAIRIPNHPYLLQLLTFFDGLFSTSANLAGDNIPEKVTDINLKIINSIEYVVLDKFDINSRYCITPSTIIDFTNDNPKVIRQGTFLKK